jgi:antitoxin component YwqK of YwqJK toxin-antitoxin module
MNSMKLTFLFLSLVALINAQVKPNDKGLYANEDGSLYTGLLENDENGIKKSVIQVKEGQLDGEAKYFYTSGKLMETGMFAKGLRSGKWVRYNETGMMTGFALYKDGKKDGTWLVFDDNGKKCFEMTYKNGEKTGVWNSWDETGNLVSTKDYSQVN